MAEDVPVGKAVKSASDRSARYIIVRGHTIVLEIVIPPCDRPVDKFYEQYGKYHVMAGDRVFTEVNWDKLLMRHADKEGEKK